MRKIKFNKYQGAGNDFIMVDARALEEVIFSNSLVKDLCDRHFGIGADGLILLLPSEKSDFYMKYFNSDGIESTMCGNGGRCIAAFAERMGIIKDKAVFSGIDGEHIAFLSANGIVKLKMIDVNGYDPFDNGYLINTGSPHLVVYHENLNDMDVFSQGRKLRFHPLLAPGGANINFVEKLLPGEIIVRTYERGVEDETLACGTGSVASAIITYITHSPDKTSYLVHVRGGELKVSFTPEGNNCFSDIWLEGPASFVFEGEIIVSS